MSDKAVAIIGLGCRFPGAGDPESYWRLLAEGVDAITPVPPERFDPDAYFSPRSGTPGRTVSRYGGFLEDPFRFDAAFFGISPLEAQGMDPQQRMLLEVVWEALEDAAIRPSTLAGSQTGVFVGQATAEYDEWPAAVQHDIRSAVGSRLRGVAAGRVSYAFDLRGPSLVLDTACSSSLVAVHQARQSLLLGESDLAIASGVNLVLTPTDAIAYSQGDMLAPDGRCKFGDRSADGFVRSEGVGVVVLKRLTDAVRDGDPVRALLLGTSVTNDGSSSGLLVQPAVEGQAQMLRAAWRSAGIEPGEVDYVEAHGTGTQVGDSVELRALRSVVADTHAGAPLLLGSVKTNIGHTEAAAGIAGLIKAVLIAQHRRVPASLHLTEPHPLLQDDSPLEVVRTARPLEPRGERAVLGVSSFGLAGTNAHAVVGEYVPEPAAGGEPPAPPVDGAPHLLVLSARSPRVLRRLAGSHARRLAEDTTTPLREYCGTAARARDHHHDRLWVTSATRAELATRLEQLAAGMEITGGGIAEAGFRGPRRAVFVFPGQGSQWLGMGRQLLESSAEFRRKMTECDALVRAETGGSVLELLTGDAPLPDAVQIVQPALWAVQVSLAAVWRAAGVEPGLCIGHSMGEVTAAHVAGILSLKDAAAVICRRSRLMQRLSGQGLMLATDLSAAEAEEVVAPHRGLVTVAARNAPGLTVLSGDTAAVQEIAVGLAMRDRFARTVKVDVASHSPAMDLLRADLLAELASLAPRPAEVPMLSTVTGALVEGTELTAEYWVDNLRQPVRFTDAVRTAAEGGQSVFIEVSPHPVLVPAIRQTLAEADVPQSAVASLHRHQDERLSFTQALGTAHALGVAVDFGRWFPHGPYHARLPRAVWDDTRFERSAAADATARPAAAGSVRDVPLAELRGGTARERVALDSVEVLYPALGLDAIRRTVRDLPGAGPLALRDVRLGDKPVGLDGVTAVRVTIGAAGANGERTVAVRAVRGGDAREETLTAVLCPAHAAADEDWSAEIGRTLARCGAHLDREAFRRLAARHGVLAPAPHRTWRRDGEAAAHVHRTAEAWSATVEACLQPLLAAAPQDPAAGTPLPVSFGSVRLHAELPAEIWSLVRWTDGPEEDVAEVRLVSIEGRLLAEFTGIRLVRLPGRAAGAVGGRLERLLPVLARHRLGSLAGLARDVLTTAQRTVDLVMTAASAPSPGAPAAPPETAGPSPTGHPAPSVVPVTPVSAAQAPAPEDAGTSDASEGAESPERVLLSCAAAALGLTGEALDARRPLRDYGLDSLMAVRLGRRLQTEFGIALTSADLLGGDSVKELVRKVYGNDTVNQGLRTKLGPRTENCYSA
ncbi:beta-ketoacyl synthase N-terminal-like domain-containing protein [Streptomyces sp. CSDS2]|uniref:type I polyketide synthase n=1 Tax=Streptomyces sp. CSDS2 TaxID=3055051 RepID=UPI0025B12B45|nr:beta-ketoacyl synthase N-terminal-like domain-containing protein [Streptomyces sp. CSDS2]MDN3260912.1 beta-ketoacyl synthase N-terminal-like domain-containing protein [Streptomyces sp. CSDS2]